MHTLGAGWDVLAVTPTLLYFHLCLLHCVSVMQLLSKPKFSSVEKIKTIGTTYMAAVGLTHTPLRDENKVFAVVLFCF